MLPCSICLREGRGAMVRAWRFALSLPAVRFQTPLGPAFSEKKIPPLSMLGHFYDAVSLGKALILTCFTWLRCEWIPGGTEMAMCTCTISSMRRYGYRTVGLYAELKWHTNEQVHASVLTWRKVARTLGDITLASAATQDTSRVLPPSFLMVAPGMTPWPFPDRDRPKRRSHTSLADVSVSQIAAVSVNAKHLYDICTMSDQRRRRWADVVQIPYKCFVFAGMDSILRHTKYTHSVSEHGRCFLK